MNLSFTVFRMNRSILRLINENNKTRKYEKTAWDE